MQGFFDFMEKYLVPIAARIGSQRHLIAIRDGFIGMVAITIGGSLALLINALPIPGYDKWITGESAVATFIRGANGDIWWGTLALIAITATFGIAQSLWSSYGHKGLEGGLVAMAIFLLATPQTHEIVTESGEKLSPFGVIHWSNLGSAAIFYGLIIAIVSVELLNYLSRIKKLEIKLPDGVPPAVAGSFQKLLPGIFTIFILGYVNRLFTFFGDWPGHIRLANKINEYVGKPITEMTDSPGAAVLIPLLIGILWFFGLHGANIVTPIVGPAFTTLGGNNAALAAQGATDGYHTLAGPFLDVFVFMGGSGATLGLIISMFLVTIFTRTNRYAAMLSLAGPPGVFNINEPIIFGFPIVLNPIMFIPFVLSMPVMSLVAYFAIDWGLAAPVIAQSVPWTTPPIIGAFLATADISGAILAAVNLAISTLIYLPFLVASLRQERKAGAAQEGNTLSV
ncbi:MAG: PTS sugar transporter subunit IIC [Bacilli bacterium]